MKLDSCPVCNIRKGGLKKTSPKIFGAFEYPGPLWIFEFLELENQKVQYKNHYGKSYKKWRKEGGNVFKNSNFRII